MLLNWDIIFGVLSVDLLSTTMTSVGGCFCVKTDSSVSPINSSPLFVGIMTQYALSEEVFN